MAYTVVVEKAVSRQIRRLPKEFHARIYSHLFALENDPRPPGCLKLQGEENVYRIRVGDYRILYEVRDEVLLVLVVKVAHRSDVYR